MKSKDTKKVEQVQSLKVKTKVRAGEGDPGRLAQNHNTSLKVKTKVRAGEDPNRLAGNHNITLR